MIAMWLILFLTCSLLMIVGLITPKAVLWWAEDKTRRNVVKYYASAALLFFILFIVQISNIPGSPEIKDLEKRFPFKFLETKDQRVGNLLNTMDLFYFEGEIDINKLKQLCKEKKDNFKNNGFYFLVLFDKKENASFPSTPFTAEYGTEPEKFEHIRAMYVYNKVNGYSELSIYDKKITIKI